jgi:hypothetical protein
LIAACIMSTNCVASMPVAKVMAEDDSSVSSKAPDGRKSYAITRK